MCLLARGTALRASTRGEFTLHAGMLLLIWVYISVI